MSKQGNTNDELEPLSSFDKDLDLEVTVKGIKEGEEKVFHYNSASLGAYFGFFQTMMGSGMKEAHTKKVTVEDINPEDFENAVSYLIDPKTCAGVSSRNIIKVAYLYDRLDSRFGLDLVESVISRAFESWEWTSRCNAPKALNEIVAGLSKAQEYGLAPKLSRKSIENIKNAISYSADFRVSIFQERHIRALEPMLRDQPDIFKDIFRMYCKGHSMETTFFAELLVHRLEIICHFDIIRQLNPSLTIVIRDLQASYPLSSKEYPYKELCFHSSKELIDAGHLGRCHVRIGRCSVLCPNSSEQEGFHFSDWAVDFTGKVAYVYPASGHHFLPPKDSGWIPLPPNRYTHLPPLSFHVNWDLGTDSDH